MRIYAYIYIPIRIVEKHAVVRVSSGKGRKQKKSKRHADEQTWSPQARDVRLMGLLHIQKIFAPGSMETRRLR